MVTGRLKAGHLHNLQIVLQHLRSNGIRLCRENCSFFQKKVEYLGHSIHERGIHTSHKKVQAVADAYPLRNVQDLCVFLGLLNYNTKFVSNLASTLHPLHKLLRANKAWNWSKSCDAAFQEAKQKLTSALVLAH